MNTDQIRVQAVKHLGAAIKHLQKASAPPTWINTLEAIEHYTIHWDTSATLDVSPNILEEERYKNACRYLNDLLEGYHYNSNKTFYVGHEEPISEHPTISVGVQDKKMGDHLRQFLAGGCLWQGFAVEIKVVGRMEVRCG